jgi:hypothetical protein
MRKLIIVGLAILPLISQAQFVVDDPLANNKLMTQLQKWIADMSNQQAQKLRLNKIFQEDAQTKEKVAALAELKKEIEKHLHSINEVKNLRLNDLNVVLKEVYGVGNIMDYSSSLPFMTEYNSYAQKASSAATTNELYDFLLGGTTAYNSPQSGNFNQMYNNLREQKIKEYGINLTSQKRKIAAANAYQRIAEHLSELAEDLSRSINKEGEQRMTTGERLEAQKMANDYSIQALELKAKADALMNEAMNKTEVLQDVDQSLHNQKIRKALVNTKL